MSKITVIVPVYQVEQYLRKCVDSILAQTFKDFELILVDDGSSDNCPAICDAYAANDTRVHVIHQQNGGLSAARNAGLDWLFANSNSKYVAFIDSDDWVREKFLEILEQESEKHDSAITACDFVRQMNGETDFAEIITVPACAEIPAEDFWCERWSCAASACYKLFKKELFASLRFPVGKLYEDQVLMPHVIFQAKNVFFVDLPLYVYRYRDGSIIHGRWTPKQLDFADSQERQIVFFDSLRLYRARNKALLNYLCAVGGDLRLIKKTPGYGKSYAQQLVFHAKELKRKYGRDMRLPISHETYGAHLISHPLIFHWFVWKPYRLLEEIRKICKAGVCCAKKRIK